MPVPKRIRKRVEIYDSAARIVDETCAALHQSDLALPYHVLGICRLRHVHSDDVAPSEEIIERGCGLGVALPQNKNTIPVENAHSHGLREHGELAANIAIADDAQRLSAHLVAANGRLIPTALMRGHRFGEHTSQQHDDFGNSQLRDAACIGERCVKDWDTLALRRLEINLVGTYR